MSCLGGATGLRRRQFDVTVWDRCRVSGRQLLVQEEFGDRQVRGLWME